MKKLLIALLLIAIPSTAFSLWKVPSGWKVKSGRVLVTRSEIRYPTLVKSPDGKVYGKVIFTNGQAQTLGWKPIRQQNYDSENYTATPTETETATEVVRDWTNLQPRMSVNARKKAFRVFLKTMGAGLIQTAHYWINDYFGEFDDSNPKRDEWIQYKADVKTAYATIVAEVHPSISDYNLLVDYIKCVPDPLVNGWQKYIPEEPLPE